MMTARIASAGVIVTADGAGRTFGADARAVVALQSVTCQIHFGDRIAIMGPSGSGKSTLLHLLAGLELPSCGSVTWPGIGSIESLRPGRVGMVFQSRSLISSLDVTENVSLPLLLMDHPPADARSSALGALEQLGIADLATKLPEELSGGQSQRVAIARVLAQQPTLIFADEPTGQLDRETATTVIDTLLAAADSSDAAVVVSTHDPDVAGRFSTRWSIEDGRLDVSPHPTTEEDLLCSI